MTAHHKGFSVKDIISVTKELTAVLAAEVSLLKQMKVRDIEPLQKDKLRLTDRLEQLKQDVKDHPEVIQQASEEDLLTYRQLANDFEHVMIENHNYLLMARQVNARIVGAIKAAIRDQQSSVTYDARGTDKSGAASLRLNEVI